MFVLSKKLVWATVFIFFLAGIISCAKIEEDKSETTNSGLGESSGDLVSVSGYSSSGSLKTTVTVQSYENGFTLEFNPSSSLFYCSLGDDYVIQNSTQYKIQWSSKSDYDEYPTLYNGYVTEGGADGCSTMFVKTKVMFLTSKVGFSTNQSYKVALTDLYEFDGSTTLSLQIQL